MPSPTVLVEISKVTTSGYHDITSYVRSFSIGRGRSRELDKFDAGQISITLNNRDRAFDPLYTSSPFNGAIVPRALIVITIGGVVSFKGIISDWNLSYDVSGQSIATVTAFDIFSIVSQQTFQTATSTSGYTTYVFINSVMSDSTIGFPGITLYGTVDSGQTFIDSQNIIGLNVLDFWQLLERTERGFLFASKSGSVTFRDRRDYRDSGVIMSDSGSDIAYSNLSVMYGTELLYNKAIMSRRGGASAATAVNASSGTAYGYSTYEDSDLLYRTDAELVDASASLVYEYGEPEYRFDSATFDLHGLDAAKQASLLGLDMADVVTVKFTPNGVGSQISKTVRIIGISHDSEPGTHQMSFKFQEINNNYFILDSSSFGLLDSNVLGW
jgi:hypothetical protein